LSRNLAKTASHFLGLRYGILLIAALASPASAADAMFGSFTLDASRSTGGERCAVFTLEDLGGGKFRFSGQRVAASGAHTTEDGIFAFDGTDHPDGAGGTLAFTRIDEGRYAMVTKSGVQSTAVRTLSDDGTTLVEEADGVEDEREFHASRVYLRGTGVCEP
jgi:hypothetical protein